MSISKKNGHHVNGVARTPSDVNIGSMITTTEVDKKRRQAPFEPQYDETAYFLEKHEEAKKLLTIIHDSIDPVIENLQAQYPNALVQLAEVLTGWEQKVRDNYEAKKKQARQESRRHGSR